MDPTAMNHAWDVRRLVALVATNQQGDVSMAAKQDITGHIAVISVARIASI